MKRISQGLIVGVLALGAGLWASHRSDDARAPASLPWNGNIFDFFNPFRRPAPPAPAPTPSHDEGSNNAETPHLTEVEPFPTIAPAAPVRPATPVANPNDPLGTAKFSDLQRRYTAARQKIFRYASTHSRRFRNLKQVMENRCAAGSGVDPGERNELIQLIRDALSDAQDPKLGVAIRKRNASTGREAVYNYSERDFFMMVSTAMSEASGLGVTSNRVDDFSNLAQMNGVLFVIRNRMRDAGRNAWRIATVPQAFSGWDPGRKGHIPCILAQGWGSLVTSRAVRSFQYFNHPDTKFRGDFSTNTWYFARGGRPFSNTGPQVNRPIVVFPGGREVSLYAGFDNSSEYHHFYQQGASR